MGVIIELVLLRSVGRTLAMLANIVLFAPAGLERELQ